MAKKMSLAATRRRLNRALRVLRYVEWEGVEYGLYSDKISTACPYCGREQKTSRRMHTKECELAKLIGAERG